MKTQLAFPKQSTIEQPAFSAPLASEPNAARTPHENSQNEFSVPTRCELATLEVVREVKSYPALNAYVVKVMKPADDLRVLYRALQNAFRTAEYQLSDGVVIDLVETELRDATSFGIAICLRSSSLPLASIEKEAKTLRVSFLNAVNAAARANRDLITQDWISCLSEREMKFAEQLLQVSRGVHFKLVSNGGKSDFLMLSRATRTEDGRHGEAFKEEVQILQIGKGLAFSISKKIAGVTKIHAQNESDHRQMVLARAYSSTVFLHIHEVENTNARAKTKRVRLVLVEILKFDTQEGKLFELLNSDIQLIRSLDQNANANQVENEFKIGSQKKKWGSGPKLN